MKKVMKVVQLATRSEVLDELCLRLDTEAPAGADRASATLWAR